MVGLIGKKIGMTSIIGENGAKHIAEALKLMTEVNSVSLNLRYYY